MKFNSQVNVLQLGQSIWLGYIDEELLNGELQKKITSDGIMGVTSNPAIFEKSLKSGDKISGSLNNVDAAAEVFKK